MAKKKTVKKKKENNLKTEVVKDLMANPKKEQELRRILQDAAEQNGRISLLEQRIDRIVDAVSKSKSVKGL